MIATLIKDLVFTRNNVSLDIARLCSLLSVIGFWIGVFWDIAANGRFDPVQTGTGCAALFAGAAAWIHFRQRHESGSDGGAA